MGSNTIGEVVQRVLSLYSKGADSDDSRLTPMHVYHKLKNLRSLIITQEARKKRRLNDFNYQTLDCIEMIPANMVECDCITPIGCKILRSKHKIPKLVTGFEGELIKFITDVYNINTYDRITWAEKRNKAGNKYTANRIDSFFLNGYLFVTHRTGPKVLMMKGVFEDPLEVNEFNKHCSDCEDCDDNECEPNFDKEFPIDADRVEIIIEMALKELLGVFSSSKEDITNNTRDNVIQESK